MSNMLHVCMEVIGGLERFLTVVRNTMTIKSCLYILMDQAHHTNGQNFWMSVGFRMNI